MLLLMDLRWVAVFLCSAAVHELFHYIALLLLRCNVHHISIGIAGAKMITAPLSRKEELLSSLAGPAGGFLLILLGRFFPRLALCALFHSVINLLPVYPLDGGRVLRCILPRKYHRRIEFIVNLLLLIFAFRFLGWIGLIGAFLITQRSLLEKYLAKNRLKGYNIPTIK